MIDFIGRKLENWANWVSKRAGNGLGYGQSQLSKMGEPGGGGQFAGLPYDVSEDDLCELERIVVCLPFDLRQAVVQCYLMPGLAKQHWEACGCSKVTYYNRLKAAHLLIMEALQVGIDEVPLLVVGRAALVAPLLAGNAVARANSKKVLTI